LIYAARESCAKVVRILLDVPGVEVDTHDHREMSAMDYARKTSVLEFDGPSVKIIKMIKAHR
jgi:hypothetical protein